MTYVHWQDEFELDTRPKPHFVSCWRYSIGWLVFCAVLIIITAIFF